MWLGSKLTAVSDYLFRTFFRVLFRYDIFISYARRDGKDYALKLRDQLRQLDFSCFLDFDELPAGNSLTRSLRRALRRSATLVLVGTERAVVSRYVELEVSDFAGTGRAIIPIDIEGTLAAAPWPVVRERDLVWIDETRAALERGVPSPNVADQIDKLFKYTRRNSRVRAQVLATLGLFVLVVAASLFLIRQQVNAATAASAEAERQKGEAATQKQAADQASALAETRRVEAERATDAARQAQHDAEVALDKAATAEKAAVEATAEAKRQEQAALRNAERARAEQQRAEAERARAEEGTRYVQSQSAGVHAALALDGGELEQSALLAVESLKRSLTPEGYAAWERAAGLLPRSLPPDPTLGGEGEVTTVAYSPEGEWLALGGKGGATLRPAGGGEPVRLRLRREGDITKISFVRRGELVALAGEGGFELWDVRGNKRLFSLDGYYSGSVAVSPDGRYVAATGPDHVPRLKVYDTAAPAEALFDVELEDVRYAMSVAFSPDGRWLAVACMPAKVLVWDASALAKADAQRPTEFSLASGDDTVPRHLAFSPQGRLGILSTTRDRVALNVWWLAAGGGSFGHEELLRVTMPPNSDLMRWSMSYSPDEDFVAVASNDTARVWETARGREVARVVLGEQVRAVAFSRDGRALTTVSGGVAQSWKAEFGPAPLRFGQPAELKAVAAGPRGEWVATAGKDGARLFRTPDWAEFKRLDAAGAASALDFSPDGLWLLVKGDGKAAAVFDTRTWEAVKALGPLEGDAELRFSRDGRWLVVANGRFLKLLEPGSWREARSFEHTDPVRKFSFSPDGQRLFVTAEGSYRRGIQRVFDTRERDYVWGLDGGLLACTTIDDQYTPRLKEAGPLQGAEAAPCPDVKGHADGVLSLLTEAREWEAVSLPLGGRPSSPDGLWLVAVEHNPDSSFDTVLKLKEGNIHRRVATIVRDGRPDGWSFTPDGRWLLVAHGGFVTPWPLKPADMIAGACARLRRRRDLPADVWRKYFSGEKAEPTCAP